MKWTVLAFGGFVGAFANRIVEELFGCLPWLAERIIKRAVLSLPIDAREEYCANWLAELEELERRVRGIPLVIFALRIRLRAPAVAREIEGVTSLRHRLSGFVLDEIPANAGRLARLMVRRVLPRTAPPRTAPMWRRRRFRSFVLPRNDRVATLQTATLCLLAFGATMVSSSSPAGGHGNSYIVGFAVSGVLGLLLMRVLARDGIAKMQSVTAPLLATSFVLVTAVHVSHIDIKVEGSQHWVGGGSLQFQLDELMKLALVLYSAALLARRPMRVHKLRELARPLLLTVGAACVLMVTEPDAGAALVIAFTTAAMLLAAGMPLRKLALVVSCTLGIGLTWILATPYARARLTSFLDLWAHASSSGYQAVHGAIAFKSGGFFGAGVGHLLHQLPQASTSFIFATTAEHLGALGVCVLLLLYGLIANAGLRTAKAARSLYAALIAVGVTTLIVSQALLNAFGVIGLAPLTGVTLPLVSFGASSMIVTLAAMGLLMNIAAGSTGHVRAVGSWPQRCDS